MALGVGERFRFSEPVNFGARTPTSLDPATFIDVGIDQTEADRTSTGNLNCLLLYPNYEFDTAGDGAATGNNYGLRLIPTVSGNADPFATYITDSHGFWKNSSGLGSMIALTGEVEVMPEATGGNGGAMIGVVGEVVLRHTTGLFDRIDNLRAHSTHHDAGLVDECHGVNIVHEQMGGNTNQYFGIKVTGPTVTGTGTVTTAYGLYLNIPSTGITNRWAIFSATTAQSYFGGKALFDQGIDLTGGAGGGAGTFGFDSAIDGIRMQAKTGGTYDLTFIAEAGSYIMRVPTGTANLEVVGSLRTAASVAGGAGFRVPHGTAPTSPVNGDIWTTTAGLFVRINGATVGPLS